MRDLHTAIWAIFVSLATACDRPHTRRHQQAVSVETLHSYSWVMVTTMTSREPVEQDDDSPLLRAAYQHADDLDRAETPAERKRAWWRLIPSFLAALAEDFLRESALFGALLSCVVAVVAGVDSGQPAWMAGLIAAALAGSVLALVAALRRWPVGWQWTVFVSVIVVEVGLIILMEQATG